MKSLNLKEHTAQFQSNDKKGPLVKIEDLAREDLDIVTSKIFRNINSSNADNIDAFYESYVNTLHEHGIMCPHPQVHRLYSNLQKSDAPLGFSQHKFYVCLICKSSVINK